MRRADGFSIIELVVAMGIMLGVTAAVFGLMNPSQGSFSTQPEVSDMQQRLRVAQDTLSRDLIMAGAGMYGSLGNPAPPQPSVGALNYYFAPVLPFRQGALNDDGPGKFFTDRMTVLYVPSTTAQTTLATALNSGAGNVAATLVADSTGCVAHTNACGFSVNKMILIFDDTGNYDTFTITSVVQQTASITVNKPPDATPTTYPVGSKVVEVIDRTYFLKSDPATSTYQLVYYDGSINADVPVVDHLVGLTFEYYGDRQPPLMRKALSDTAGPWTSYGPKPPAPGVKPTAYPAGENCVFQSDGSPTPAPRLSVLGDGSNPNTLIKLTAAELTDGPWCPDENNANRWDADLLRIRKIGVTLRVEAAVDALRGPASALFTRGGTSRGGNKWVPDQEIQFQVSPRNMNLGR